MNITAIILTKNEEIHLERCILNIAPICKKILIIDSFSTDTTELIAKKHNCIFIQNKWVNHAQQLNFGINQLPKSTEWVLKIDADEYLTQNLVYEIKKKISNISGNVHGIYINRRIKFQGKFIRYGGIMPVKVLRIFKYPHGRSENRWMDDHLVVKGNCDFSLKHELIDDNLQPLSIWIEKHNKYSNREALDMISLEYNLNLHDSAKNLSNLSGVKIKRTIKENIYSKIPCGLRALMYFIYRYIIRFGFLDGKMGYYFHFFQCLWYRTLVDAKIQEVKNYSTLHNVNIKFAIKKILDIDLN